MAGFRGGAVIEIMAEGCRRGLNWRNLGHLLTDATTILSCSFGASSRLYAKAGGGIFTKTPTSAWTLSVRLGWAFRKTVIPMATLLSLRTTLAAITLATSPAWVRTSSTPALSIDAALVMGSALGGNNVEMVFLSRRWAFSRHIIGVMTARIGKHGNPTGAQLQHLCHCLRHLVRPPARPGFSAPHRRIWGAAINLRSCIVIIGASLRTLLHRR